MVALLEGIVAPGDELDEPTEFGIDELRTELPVGETNPTLDDEDRWEVEDEIEIELRTCEVEDVG